MRVTPLACHIEPAGATRLGSETLSRDTHLKDAVRHTAIAAWSQRRATRPAAGPGSARNMSRQDGCADLKGAGKRRAKSAMVDEGPSGLEHKLAPHLGTVPHRNASHAVLLQALHKQQPRMSLKRACPCPAIITKIAIINRSRRRGFGEITSRNGGSEGGTQELSAIMSSTLPAHTQPSRAVVHACTTTHEPRPTGIERPEAGLRHHTSHERSAGTRKTKTKRGKRRVRFFCTRAQEWTRKQVCLPPALK